MSTTKQRNVIDVSVANFNTEVIQRSQQIPVLVDFWAPWCGPCRMLGPVLERLASEPNSKFVLAKVNSDQNQQLSMQYSVRGIPAVKAFVNGRVVDEFVGAQPEPVVRQFIQRVVSNHSPLGASTQHSQAKPNPIGNDPAARLSRARQLLRQGKGCEAQVQLQDFPGGNESVSAGKLLPLAQFMCQASRGTSSNGSADLDLLYRQVADGVQRRDYGTAMYNLLAILNQDGRYRNGQAKNVMLGLFELIGENDPLTQAYRQQLDMLAI